MAFLFVEIGIVEGIWRERESTKPNTYGHTSTQIIIWYSYSCSQVELYFNFGFFRCRFIPSFSSIKIRIQICTQLLAIVWFCDLSECNVANMLTELKHTHTLVQSYNDIVWLKSHFTLTARMPKIVYEHRGFYVLFFPSTQLIFSSFHLCHSSTWWFDCRDYILPL